MEVEGAVRRHLLEQSVMAAYVGNRGYKHQPSGEFKLDGSGKRMFVVRNNGEWRPPDDKSTVEYPQVVVDFWADCTRNEDGDTDEWDCVDNAKAMYRAADPFLHDANDVLWPERDPHPLRVLTCTRSIGTVVTWKQAAAGGPVYAVEYGETACVSVPYNLAVWH